MPLDIIYNMKREMFRRGLSAKTITTYLFHVRKFLDFAKNKPLNTLSKKDVREFLCYLQSKNYSGSSLNVAHNALRFMMIEILHKGMYLKIKFSKIPKKITEYLTKDEVTRLLSSIKNEKHFVIAALMYGAGLRVSEATQLKKEDFYIENSIGWVRNGKGGKDRPFIIPEILKEKLSRIAASSSGYLFEGRNSHITARSIQKIVSDAGKKAKINKHVHPHMLRHSFTTHLLENGEDITTVQGLLGHVHPETTLGYSHAVKPRLIKTKSPLDSLLKNNHL